MSAIARKPDPLKLRDLIDRDYYLNRLNSLRKRIAEISGVQIICKPGEEVKINYSEAVQAQLDYIDRMRDEHIRVHYSSLIGDNQ